MMDLLLAMKQCEQLRSVFDDEKRKMKYVVAFFSVDEYFDRCSTLGYVFFDLRWKKIINFLAISFQVFSTT